MCKSTIERKFLHIYVAYILTHKCRNQLNQYDERKFLPDKNYSKAKYWYMYMLILFSIHISICSNKIYYSQFTYRWIVHVRDFVNICVFFSFFVGFTARYCVSLYFGCCAIVRFKFTFYIIANIDVIQFIMSKCKFWTFCWAIESVKHIEYSRYLCCIARFLFSKYSSLLYILIGWYFKRNCFVFVFLFSALYCWFVNFCNSSMILRNCYRWGNMSFWYA